MKSTSRNKLLATLASHNPVPAQTRPWKRRAKGVKRRRAKILAVDDEPSSLELISETLSEAGYSVLCASSVKEARVLIQANSDLTLILSDLRMPEEDGFELLRFLNDNLRFSHIPVLVLSSCVDKRAVMLALELGARDYIAKPFNSNMLLERVKRTQELGHSTVLLVTDCQASLAVLTRALTRESFVVLSAQNGEAAMKLLESEQADVILCDLALEDMTGFDFLLQVHEKVDEIPIIFIEDAVVKCSETEVISSGGHGLIRKPFHNSEVVQKIRSGLGINCPRHQ